MCGGTASGEEMVLVLNYGTAGVCICVHVCMRVCTCVHVCECV